MAKVLFKVDDPVKNTSTASNLTPREHADIRDRIAELINGGNSINPDTRGSIYTWLRGKLGTDLADKLITHTYIFNQRPDIQKMPTEGRIQAYYSNIPTTDEALGTVLGKVKNLGYGVVPGWRQSASSMSQGYTGGATTPSQDKILFRVTKK